MESQKIQRLMKDNARLVAKICALEEVLTKHMLDIPDGGYETICVDFDGVLHSYTSQWINPKEIPDPPVEGAIEWLTEMTKHFHVNILSSRARWEDGEDAIVVWLYANGLSWEAMEAITIEGDKPHALMYIDDRGFRFTGAFPTAEEIKKSKTWNRE